MKPIDLIRKDLGEEVWSECYTLSREIEPDPRLSPFATSKTYMILGRCSQFDFPGIRIGTYCLYDANERRAIRLTRAGKEIETILSDNWAQLPNCDPQVLSQLIFMFFDGAMMSSHCVLQNSDSLRSFGKGLSFGEEFVLDEKEFWKAEPNIETTRSTVKNDLLTIRVVTLSGWGFDKRNLGIEHIRISSSGDVELCPREVLSKKIFKSVPSIQV
ncbi:hypothetical protein AB1L30_10955 [Bremerella sp. JC817]|uniref:hypothetical protein n=1 Tax=Bremerella sp. JC817 TaxID=3231756 RepID=UPI00345A73EA